MTHVSLLHQCKSSTDMLSTENTPLSPWTNRRAEVDASSNCVDGRHHDHVIWREWRGARRQKLLGWIWRSAVTRRRSSSRFCIIATSFIAFQTIILISFSVTYRPQLLKDLFYGPSDSAEDEVECRRRFLSAYENYCSQALRPLPLNYLAAAPRDQSAAAAAVNVNQTRTRQYTSFAAELCPCVPHDIEPAANVNQNTSLDWNEQLKGRSIDTTQTDMGQGQSMRLGGRWRPTGCIARHRVAIIVPFRGRDQHLIALINNLHSVLRRQMLDFTIFVVEQVTPEIFNRGALMNVGYVEAKAAATRSIDDGGKFDCFIFHDVDMYPASEFNFYVCSAKPRHMAAYRQSWNYEKHYEGFFGGVNAFRDEHFQRINGFSNKFYGWGGEDDDLLNRVWAGNLGLDDHYPRCVARYAEFDHTRDQNNPTGKDKDKGVYYRPIEYQLDGLNTLNYTVTAYIEMSHYTKIYVNLPAMSASLTEHSDVTISLRLCVAVLVVGVLR